MGACTYVCLDKGEALGPDGDGLTNVALTHNLLARIDHILKQPQSPRMQSRHARGGGEPDVFGKQQTNYSVARPGVSGRRLLVLPWVQTSTSEVHLWW